MSCMGEGYATHGMLAPIGLMRVGSMLAVWGHYRGGWWGGDGVWVVEVCGGLAQLEVKGMCVQPGHVVVAGARYMG